MTHTNSAGLGDELESAVYCVRNTHRELQQCTDDCQRRIALLYANSQAIGSMVGLWIERAQRHARGVPHDREN